MAVEEKVPTKMTQQFSSEEVSKHNQESDLWIVIHGGVYNLTKFLKEHPGGEEVLIQLAGQDGTKCFDDIGHSGEAIQLRENYKIGVISDAIQSTGGTSAPDVQETTTDDDNWEYQEHKKETSPWLPVTIGVGVAVYALIFYYIFYS